MQGETLKNTMIFRGISSGDKTNFAIEIVLSRCRFIGSEESPDCLERQTSGN